MTDTVTIYPKTAQEIYEIVASHRAKTRGSRIKLNVDSDGDAIRIIEYVAVTMEPNEIKKKGIGLTAGQ